MLELLENEPISIVEDLFSEYSTGAKPFLKWAGGKSQLLTQFQQFYPIELKKNQIEYYYEPFAGAGAVFFDLIQKYNFKKVFLSDINPELILVYKVIQNEVEKLILQLEDLKAQYLSASEEDRIKLFYEIRKNYNRNRLKINHLEISDNWIERASQMIFLNKTCFNGLFRLNKSGGFNVPFGKYKNPSFYEADNLRRVSQSLQLADIQVIDFENLKDSILPNSFIYLDPPYRPISATSAFTTYSKGDFDDNDQTRLADFCKYLHEIEAKWMLSNSEPKNYNPADNFFEELYQDFQIHRVSANRMINCKGEKRGKIEELLITNY